jgi:hypothetical protein
LQLGNYLIVADQVTIFAGHQTKQIAHLRLGHAASKSLACLSLRHYRCHISFSSKQPANFAPVCILLHQHSPGHSPGQWGHAFSRCAFGSP